MKVYWFQYQVVGESPISSFPVDMLRYDSSFPAGEADAHAIEQTLSEFHHAAPVPITLEKILPDPNWTPRDDRWRSFGWSVVPESLRIVHTIV